MGPDTNIMNIAPVDLTEAKKSYEETAYILDKSAEVKIVDQNTYSMAATFLQDIKARAKTLEGRRKLITAPLDAAKKAVMDLFREPTEFLAKAEINIKTAMLSYTQEQERARKEAEQKAQEAAEKEEARKRKQLEARAEKAQEKGNAEKAEELRQKADEVFVPRPIIPPQIKPVAGISERKVWKHRIVDQAKIPREYLIPDEKTLGALAKSTQGRVQIPGVEFYFESTIASRLI